uniref:Uncharacterized protein n=1 Tax=Oryza brachyantha TaxID=4533 RepID=J3LXH8_ORYBR
MAASELLVEGVATLSNDDMEFATSPQGSSASCVKEVAEAAICLVGILATMSFATLKSELLGRLGG